MTSSFYLPQPSGYDDNGTDLQELNSDGSLTLKTYNLASPNAVTTTSAGGSSLRRRKVYKPSRKTRRTKPKTKKQYRRKRYTKRCKKSHCRSRH